MLINILVAAIIIGLICIIDFTVYFLQDTKVEELLYSEKGMKGKATEEQSTVLSDEVNDGEDECDSEESDLSELANNLVHEVMNEQHKEKS